MISRYGPEMSTLTTTASRYAEIAHDIRHAINEHAFDALIAAVPDLCCMGDERIIAVDVPSVWLRAIGMEE